MDRTTHTLGDITQKSTCATETKENRMTTAEAYDLGYDDAYFDRDWKAPELDALRHAYADGWNLGIQDQNTDLDYAEYLEFG
jgi:hypothetical protein